MKRNSPPRFGKRDLTPPKIEFAIALRAATEAVEDGIVLMFVDDQRIADLEKSLTLTSASQVRFVKLNALRAS